MALHIGSIAPDFEQDSSEGRIKLHEFLGDKWGVLFSHPADFTPVCTTELGRVAKLKAEFDKRNTKVIAVSVDPIDSHKGWLGDIEKVNGVKMNYPIIADPDRKVADRLVGNRVSAEVEWTGLDSTEMGSEAYPPG